jgi:hypothetical protein
MKIGNFARKLAGAEATGTGIPSAVAARKEWLLGRGQLIAHQAEVAKLNQLIETADAAKVAATDKLKALQGNNDGLFLRGDSPEARAVIDGMNALKNEIGVQDHLIATANRKLVELDRRDLPGTVARAEAAARQKFFKVLRDELIAQFTPEMITLICDAQMASAQAGDGLNFGPFAERYLRTTESRNTDGGYDLRIKYANELIREYGEP